MGGFPRKSDGRRVFTVEFKRGIGPAPTVLGISTVDFPYTAFEVRSRISSSRHERHYRPVSDTIGKNLRPLLALARLRCSRSCGSKSLPHHGMDQ